MWLASESNQEHADFQSTALPTKLPSHLVINLVKKFFRIQSIVLTTPSRRLSAAPSNPFGVTRIKWIPELSPKLSST